MIKYRLPNYGTGDWFELKKTGRYESNRDRAIQAAKEFMENTFADIADVFPKEITLLVENNREVTFFIDVREEPIFEARLKI